MTRQVKVCFGVFQMNQPTTHSLKATNLKAVVFDLDGTLIDSAPDLHVALNHILAGDGRRELSLTEVTSMIGDGVLKLVARAFAAAGGMVSDEELEGLVRRFLDFYEPHSTDLTRPYPGAVQALARLGESGLALGVCTNKPQAATISILRDLGLNGYFPVVIGGDSIPGVRKPDPRHLLAVIEGLGATPGQSVMVGDNENDVAAARAAKVQVVVASFGYSRGPVGELDADMVFDRFDDLPKVLGLP